MTILVLSCKFSFGQLTTIGVPDPSFEHGQANSSNFYTWKSCRNTPDELNGSFYVNSVFPHYFIPTNGNLYAHCSGGEFINDNNSESIGVKLDSMLFNGRQHFFYIDAASCDAGNGGGSVDSIVSGQLVVFLGTDTCGLNQQIWLSPRLDSVWHRYKVTFYPDSNYQYILLMGHCPVHNCGSHIMLDNMSNIYAYPANGIEAVEEERVRVYPNPCGNELRIKNEELGIEKIEIIDLLGRVVLTQQFNNSTTHQIQLDVSALSKGIYFIKATDEKGNVKNVKFVKE